MLFLKLQKIKIKEMQPIDMSVIYHARNMILDDIVKMQQHGFIIYNIHDDKCDIRIPNNWIVENMSGNNFFVKNDDTIIGFIFTADI